MRNTILSLLCCLIFTAASAEPNTLVMGKIRNIKLVKHIELEVNTRYLNNDAEIHYSNILEDGTFAFAVEITEPQLASLYFSRNKNEIYLEPNDTLMIEFDATTFGDFKYSGRAGKNNKYLETYQKLYPKEKDVFKYLQYRVGSFWYKVAPKHDEWMRTLTKPVYFEKMALRQQEPIAQLEFYNKNNPTHLTTDFIDFFTTEINYEWAYHMMLFGNVYKGIHGLDETFFDFTEKVSLQNEQIGSHWFRMYLLAYSNHKHMRETEKGKTPYSGQYVLSEQFLSGKALAFIQSEMIAIGFRKNYLTETLPEYQHFLTHNPYVEYDDKIVSAYQKVMKTAIGTPAPEFVLGAEGSQIKLSDYKGKVVFLNFWASWCRPCIKKMDEMKTLQKDMEAKGVVFIHISFDKDNETWQKKLKEKQYDGTHVIVAGNVDSKIAKQYDVRAIPQFFIIDKNGKFAEKPLVISNETIEKALQQAITAK